MLATVCCALLACQQNAPKQDTKPLSIQAVGQPHLTDSIILSLIYGHVKKSKDACYLRHYDKFYSDVPADSLQFSAAHWKALDARQNDYYVEHIEEIGEDSTTKYLVILGGSGMSCHVCPGVCAGAVFTRKGDQWILETYENDIAVLGQTGYPVNEVEVTQIDKGAYAIILKNSGYWFGINWRYFTVVIYDHGVFKKGFDDTVVYSSDNWSNAEGEVFTTPYAYTAFIDFEAGAQEYADLLLHYQGTVYDKKRRKAVFLDKIVRFKYQNGQYTTTEKLPDTRNE